MRRFVPLCLLLFLLMPLSARADQPWVEVRSQHFTLITDAGEKRGREVLTRFEQMRAAFGVIFKKASVNFPVPLQIVAFRNTKQMREFVPVFNGKPVALSGFFQPGPDRDFIVIDLATESAWEVVFHEYAHLIMNGNLPPMPVWFDEGFADFCSSFKVEGKEITIGELLEGNMSILSQSRWMHITDLFSVRHDSKDYNEGDRRSVFYAESWITVHYLILNGLFPKVGQYVTLVDDRHVPVPQAIQQAFGMDAAHFEAEIHKYFDGRTKHYAAPAPANMDGAPYNSRPLAPAESLAVLADLHFHERDHREQALGEFKQVLQQDPNNVNANRALGEAAFRQRDYKTAGEYLQRAVAQGSTDARIYYFAAMVQEFNDPQGGGDRLAEMNKLLLKSVELDPNFAEAYNFLAIVHSRQRDPQGAIAMISKAIQLSPREEIYRMNLANYLAQAREFDKALAILAELTNSSHSGIAQEATALQRQIAEFKQMQAEATLTRSTEASAPASSSARASAKDDDDDETPRPQAETPAPAPSAPVLTGPIKFLKGTLMAVSCDSAPAATLTIAAAPKAPPLSMRVYNTKSLVLMGADQFSCDWRNKRVAVNYREAPNGQLVVVSLELQ